MKKVLPDMEVSEDKELSKDAQNTVGWHIAEALPSSSSTRKRKLRLNTITLPDDDIRLQYQKIYIDAMNSADYETVMKMFREIAIPELVLVTRKVEPDPTFMLPQHMEVCEYSIAFTFLIILFSFMGAKL